MNNTVAQSPNARVWRDLYTAAIFEVDKSKLSGRIADAERALVVRARELFHADEDNIEEEQTLDDAMYALHVLGGTAMCTEARKWNKTWDDDAALTPAA